MKGRTNARIGRREKPQPDRIAGRYTEGRKYRQNERNKEGLEEGMGGRKDRKTQILKKGRKNERNKEHLMKECRKEARAKGWEEAKHDRKTEHVNGISIIKKHIKHHSQKGSKAGRKQGDRKKDNKK